MPGFRLKFPSRKKKNNETAGNTPCDRRGSPSGRLPEKAGNFLSHIARFFMTVLRKTWMEIGYCMTHEKDTVALATGIAGLVFSFFGIGIAFSIASLYFSLGAIRKRHTDFVKIVIALMLGFAGLFISIYCIVYIFIFLSLGSSELLRRIF